MQRKVRRTPSASGSAWRLVAVLTALCVAVAVAACGSSGSSSSSTSGASTSSTSGSSSADAGVANAQKLVSQYTTAPAHIAITTPIDKPIPTGKTVDYINCNVSACVEIEGSFAKAAAKLGWKVRNIVTAPTPQAIQASFQQAVNDHPDAVVWDGFTRQEAERQIAALDSQGAVLIGCCSLDRPGNGIKQVFWTADQGSLSGKIGAAWTVARTNGDAKVGYINLPDFAIFGPVYDAFQREFKADCPSCESWRLDIPVSALGKDATQRIVNFVRAHPDMNYLFLTLDDLTLGLPAALRGAGLDGQVKLLGNAPGAQNLQYIKAGLEEGSAAIPDKELGWWFADGLARAFAGVNVPPVPASPPVIFWTRDNITQTDSVPAVAPSFEEDFLKLWGKQ